MELDWLLAPPLPAAVPRQRVLYLRLREAILSGRLAADTRLPASRRPAQLPSRGKGARVRFGWLGEDALRAWWEGVTAEPGPPRKAPPKRKVATSQEVVDWGAAVREARSQSRP